MTDTMTTEPVVTDDVPVPEATEIETALIPLRLIRRDRNIRFDVELTDDFITSINNHGILQLCQVERITDDPDGYEYLATFGHRRMAAAEHCFGLDYKVPCEVVVQDPMQRAIGMLVENLQRLDMNPIDEARGFLQVVELGMTQAELASVVGRSAGHVSGRLKLLNLPLIAQQALLDSKLSLDDALTIAGFDPEFMAERIDQYDENERKGNYPGWRDAANRLKQQAELVEAMAKAEVLAQQLRDKGVSAVVGLDTSSYGKLAGLAIVAKIGAYEGSVFLDDDAFRKHRLEPCHTTYFSVSSWGRTTEYSLCAEPARHGKKGESDLKAAGKQKRASAGDTARNAKERELKAKKAEMFRARAAAQLQTKVTPDQTRRILLASIESYSTGDQARVAKLLDIDATLEGWCAEPSSVDGVARRVAVALAGFHEDTGAYCRTSSASRALFDAMPEPKE